MYDAWCGGAFAVSSGTIHRAGLEPLVALVAEDRRGAFCG
jgi:hypothetical protein